MRIDSELAAAAREAAGDQSRSRFFSGGQPEWSIAFDESISPFSAVDRICAHLESDSDRSVFVRLSGAAGEGRTTALMQAAAKLSLRPNVSVWWWNGPLGHSLRYEAALEGLEAANRKVVLFVDSAAEQSAALLDLAADLKRLDAQIWVFLEARDLDWFVSDSDKRPWSDYVDFREEPVDALRELPDAERLLNTWDRAGLAPKGLESVLPADRAPRVCEVARRVVDRSSTDDPRNERSEATLLGALLQLQMGDHLASHMASVVRRLWQSSETAGTALLYVSVSDSLGIDGLDVTTLGAVMKRDSHQRLALSDLRFARSELTATPNIVRTRHEHVARAALTVAEEFLLDARLLLDGLIRAALDLYAVGPRDQRRWSRSQHLVHSPPYVYEKWESLLPRGGSFELAEELSSLVQSHNRGALDLVSDRALLLRKAGREDECVSLCEITYANRHDYDNHRTTSRGLLHQWALALIGTDESLARLLAVYSLSDNDTSTDRLSDRSLVDGLKACAGTIPLPGNREAIEAALKSFEGPTLRDRASGMPYRLTLRPGYAMVTRRSMLSEMLDGLSGFDRARELIADFPSSPEQFRFDEFKRRLASIAGQRKEPLPLTPSPPVPELPHMIEHFLREEQHEWV